MEDPRTVKEEPTLESNEEVGAGAVNPEFGDDSLGIEGGEICEGCSEAEVSTGPEDELQDRIAQLEALLEEREHSLKHIRYEASKHENELKSFRERLERENEKKQERQRRTILESFFEPIDNLARSIALTEQWEEIDPRTASFIGGLKMVYSAFESRMEGLGLVRFDPTDEKFDPNFHEAMGMSPVEDPALDGIVIATWEPGYRCGDQVLRAARVIVGKAANPAGNS